MTDIALVTCAKLPPHERDDAPLVAALLARGATVHQPVWDDEAVDWSRFDLAVIRTTWDYWHRRDDFVRWAERVEAQTPLCNPARVVRWNTSKAYLRELEAAGVRTVPTTWVTPGARLDLATWFEAVEGVARGFIKPLVGANAHATTRFTRDTIAEAQAALDAQLDAGHDMMVQPYRAAVETHGEFSAIFFDGSFSHGVQKIPQPGDYRVQDDWGATDRRWTPTDAQRAEAERAIHAAEAALDARLLYARADFLPGPDGLEMNELELVEPSLFLRGDMEAADRLARAILDRIATHDDHRSARS